MIWRRGEWPTRWTQSFIITLQNCQNYRTISLISHSSKGILRAIFNWLEPEAEQIIAEEHLGFRAGRNTAEHIFNLRILCVNTPVSNKICTMSSYISVNPLTGYGMQPHCHHEKVQYQCKSSSHHRVTLRKG